MSKKQKTSVDRWNHAVRVAFEATPEDLADEVLGKSDTEIVAELRAAGVDVEAFDAEGDALFQRLLAARTAKVEADKEGTKKGPR